MIKVPQLTPSQSQIAMLFSSVMVLDPVVKIVFHHVACPYLVHSQLFPLELVFICGCWINSQALIIFLGFLGPALSSSAYIDDLSVLLPPLGTKFRLQVHGQPVILNSLTETAYFFTYFYLF